MDPLASQTRQPYSYASGNPVTGRDPSGQHTIVCLVFLSDWNRGHYKVWAELAAYCTEEVDGFMGWYDWFSNWHFKEQHLIFDVIPLPFNIPIVAFEPDSFDDHWRWHRQVFGCLAPVKNGYTSIFGCLWRTGL